MRDFVLSAKDGARSDFKIDPAAVLEAYEPLRLGVDARVAQETRLHRRREEMIARPLVRKCGLPQKWARFPKPRYQAARP